MANNKPIRKAVVTSALAVTMCASMLAGTTYAWFTDSAASGVNVIQSGHLDLAVYQEINSELALIDERTDLFSNVEGNPILWEPGASVSETFVIKNEGNLALKYQFNLNVTDKGGQGNSQAPDLASRGASPKSLLDVLSVSVNGGDAQPLASFIHEGYLLKETEEEITVKIQWIPGEDDNLYNVAGGLRLDLGLNVVATQYTYEYDGTGNQYDANASYVTEVYTAADLKAAMRRSGKVILMADIELDSPLVIGKSHEVGNPAVIVVDEKYDIVLDMNGKTLSLVDGAPQSCDPMIDLIRDSSLTIDGNGTFDVGANPGYSLIVPGGNLTINSGTFKIDTGLASYGSLFAGARNGTGTFIINGGYFDGGYYSATSCGENALHLLNLSDNQTVRVYGGTFVAQNPAWGDEANGGCACSLHGTNRHHGWWNGTQGVFLEGQVWTDNRTDDALPEGYTITEGNTSDGRPTYTVHYTKP